MPFPIHIIEQLIAELRPFIFADKKAGAASDSKADRDMTDAALTDLVVTQLHRAPVYIGIAFLVLIYVFNFSAVLRWGSRFNKLSRQRRFVHMLNWKESPLKLQRDFVNFFESFIVLGMYEHYQVNTAIPNSTKGKPE